MTTFNRKRIEVASLPQCADFRPRYFGSSRLEGIGERLRRPAPLIIFTLTAALVAFATNLSMHLLNLRMQNLGVSESQIGLSVAAQALGIVLIAPFTKQIIALLGVRAAFALGILVTCASLLAFSMSSGFFTVMMLRLIFATGLALLFVLSESLVVAATDSSNRGRVIGWYATSLAIGTAAGPTLVIFTGVDGLLPLGCAAVLFVATALPIMAYVKQGHELAPVTRATSFQALRIVPIAFLTAFVFGIVDNGGLSMLSIYAAQNGYENRDAATFAAIALAGSIALQLPLGYVCNKFEPKMALLISGVGAAGLLAMLPNVMDVHVLGYGVIFLTGGLLEGLYTIGLFCIAKYCRGIGIAAANGCFVSICGFGEFVGPLTTGATAHYLGPQGFIIALTVLLACYLVGLLCFSPHKNIETRSSAPARPQDVTSMSGTVFTGV